jgi:uncharacterized metal-binding protein YceD (DUF177 family)
MSKRHLREPPWKVPVATADVPETGKRVELVADAATRAAVAELAGIPSVPRLAAQFDLTPHGRDGLRVIGRVSATVEQNCVVTLDPMQTDIEEAIDLIFTASPEQPAKQGENEQIHTLEDDHASQTLDNGSVDLGVVATEFMILGIHPYPRKADAVFDPPPTDDPQTHPFAALAALKKNSGE